MQNALQDVAWERCLIEPRSDRSVESYARHKQGFPQPMISCFAPVPWMARALVDLHSEYGLLMYLDQAVADVIVLVVSQENSCRYCYAGVRALLWFHGMSRRQVQRMEQDLARAELSPRTMAAVAFARCLSRHGPPKVRAAWDALHRAGYGVGEMRRLHRVDILVTEALRAGLDTRFLLDPMPAELVKGIAVPVVTYAVRETCVSGVPGPPET